MRKDNAPVGSPGRRSLIALKIEHALQEGATYIGHVEIESFPTIGSEHDVLAVRRPGWLAFGLGNACQFSRIATIRRRRPDSIEDDDCETLAVGRPRGIAHARGSCLRAGRERECAQQNRGGQEAACTGIFARRCDQAALPSVVIIMSACSRCGTSMSSRWPSG